MFPLPHILNSACLSIRFFSLSTSICLPLSPSLSTLISLTFIHPFSNFPSLSLSHTLSFSLSISLFTLSLPSFSRLSLSLSLSLSLLQNRPQFPYTVFKNTSKQSLKGFPLALINRHHFFQSRTRNGRTIHR